MGHSHGQAHSHGSKGSEDRSPKRGRRLLIALALNLGITAAEVVGGVISGSLALLADAAHNFSDAASVLVSYIAWRISQREADRRRTFGYARAETIGALINLTTLFVIGLYLVYEAATRLFNPVEVAGTTMLVVGVIALVEDLAAAWVLRKEIGSLNVKSTYLHMIADAMATVGVIVGAVAIMTWGITWIDPVITALIAVYIFRHAYKEIREAIAVLMDSAPKDFDYDGLLAELKAIPSVEDVHHLHVWQPDEGRTALEGHIAVSEQDLAAVTDLKGRIKARLKERFGIDHATLEFELASHVRHSRELLQDR
ncbi:MULTISPECIES: cation diffusion facilitator family transporter [Microvirga]|uniref:Cation diffusion facilitator family transporter n=2 Tax=Microvirga TaxID=186650 RepID=A0ABW9Z7P2_9HYPH|nr:MULTISPECIES: cation diffusion facilitator family transporter [Microvirga]NBJ12785.1 cation diffusion facilitator family transporter [Microvirga arsenatis]NBJ26644.1 cation diffusion facilitator family transporter [Microvirga arsenatis]